MGFVNGTRLIASYVEGYPQRTVPNEFKGKFEGLSRFVFVRSSDICQKGWELRRSAFVI